jgi:hypothetical protein
MPDVVLTDRQALDAVLATLERASKATRATGKAALSGRHFRLVGSVIAVTAGEGVSRAAVFTQALSKDAGMGGEPNEAHGARKLLRELAALGVIEYEGSSRGKGTKSTVGLLPRLEGGVDSATP